jgi:hypothetical protein
MSQDGQVRRNCDGLPTPNSQLPTPNSQGDLLEATRWKSPATAGPDKFHPARTSGFFGSWELGVGSWELGVGSWELIYRAATVSLSPTEIRLPRIWLSLFSLSTVVSNRRAIDESVSPRLTR